MRTLSKPPRMPVLLIASLGCCTTLAHAESIDALYEKAKLEKTVVLYGAGPSGSHDRWINDFQRALLDLFLKANRVEEGIRSYSRVVQLAAGTEPFWDRFR